ncbi:MAG TPA: hypothetical protein VGM37_03825 [Armatimonadota bacterium]|jgi:hypothetical protein
MHVRHLFRCSGFLAALAICAALISPAAAQRVRLPRAKAPLTLLGFEAPDAADAWTGMQRHIVARPVSEGKSALSILYPKWDGKGDQYLPATIAWADGRGYSTRDWSHYAIATFDLWADGETPLDVTLELRNGPDQSPFTKELVVKPGRKNTFALPLGDAAEAVDLSDIRSVTFYGIRPKRDTTVTLDNFRLLPGQKPPLAAFDLIYPNYRDTIQPSASSVKAGAAISTEEYGIDPAGLTMTLTASSGKASRSAQARASASRAAVSVPVSGLPAGPITVVARVVSRNSGRILAAKRWVLHKQTKAEAASVKVTIDGRNNLVVSGKPFFPIGWYGNANLDQLEEIAGSPFNTILPYGVNPRSKAYVKRYLDLMQAHGMKMIYCMNDIYPTATYLDKSGWEGISGNDNIADAVVRTFRNHPAVLAWYLNDERPKELVPRLEAYYQRVRRNDPNHPCFIVIYQMPEVKYFAATTDIMGVDRYPVPSDPVTEVSNEMHVAQAAVKDHKPVWAVIQAFGWYQYDAAFPDRGRIPTEAELTAGRAPTYDEQRCMTYLALARGAKGLLYYCYYDMRVLPQYPEMWAGLKKIASEVKALSPILLEAEVLSPVTCAPADAGIETRLFDLDGQRYLMAVNGRNAPCKATFGLPHVPNGKVSVMFEGRFAMDVAGAKLTDSFKPYEAHVYDLGRPER